MQKSRKVIKVRSSRNYLLEAVAYMIKNGAEVRPRPDGCHTIRYRIKTQSPRWLKEMLYKHGLLEWDSVIVEMKVNLFSPQQKAASAGK